MDLKYTTKVLVMPADITISGDVRGVFSNVQKEFGRSADVVLQIAGYSAENETIAETKTAEWWKTFVGPVATLQRYAKLTDRRK